MVIEERGERSPKASGPASDADTAGKKPPPAAASGSGDTPLPSGAPPGMIEVPFGVARDAAVASESSEEESSKAKAVYHADPLCAQTVTDPVSAVNDKMDEPPPGSEAESDSVLARSRRHTRRSFMAASLAAVAGYRLYRWLDTLPSVNWQPEGYRKAFELNAKISQAVFHDRALSPTYSLSKAENLRVNGVYGLKMMLQPASYRLQLVGSSATPAHPQYVPDVTAWQYIYFPEKSAEDQGHDVKTPPASARTSEKMAPAGMIDQVRKDEDRSVRMPRGREEAGESYSTLPVGTPGLLLRMEELLELPRYELVTQFKCIEGWSQIVHWAGVRMVDFMEVYPPATIDGREPRFVYMETPDGDYYTGYDLDACRHPQTLLVTEMMGAPLTQYHGAPLRLHMPIKYGYKQIKRIGLISYTNDKPDDYWTKLGYDWYAGL
jgi:hypothetical protein